MQEQRCTNPHPDFPEKECGAKIKAHATFGVFTVQCWRRGCHGPVIFDFESSGTEAVDKHPVMA